MLKLKLSQKCTIDQSFSKNWPQQNGEIRTEFERACNNHEVEISRKNKDSICHLTGKALMAGTVL